MYVYIVMRRWVDMDYYIVYRVFSTEEEALSLAREINKGDGYAVVSEWRVD